jgi:hypothetical protein
MDVRAFGSVYAQTGALPYTSGYFINPASGTKNFPACRAIYIPAKPNKDAGTVVGELADMRGQVIVVENIAGDQIYPVSMTMVSGSSTVAGIIALY